MSARPVRATQIVNAELPSSSNSRYLRACLNCRLIKTDAQFEQKGCENCPEFKEDPIEEWTTPNFAGMLAMMQPTQSWVAKWQAQTSRARGLYAITVVGGLPSK